MDKSKKVVTFGEIMMRLTTGVPALFPGTLVRCDGGGGEASGGVLALASRWTM